MLEPKRALRVTALASSAQLGGAERVLLDFASQAFEHDVALRVLTPSDGPLIGILNGIGVPAEVVPGTVSMIGLMGWVRRLTSHPFWLDADLVYSVALWAHFAVATRRKHPVVWHLHEFPPTGTGTVWRTLARAVPDGVIANSQATAEAWGSAFPALKVIHNGVDLHRFQPRQRTSWIHQQLGLPASSRVIGMPAVLARWKGQLQVLEAFRALGDQFSDAHLVFLGGTIYETPAEQEILEELEAAIGGRAHLLPFQSKIELVYPELDLTLHYSLRPEPFGRVVLESMASGVPVIAAAEGGPLEVLGPGNEKTRGGWLVEPRDVPRLAATLRRVLELPREEMLEVGAAGRRRAEDHFSARGYARRVAEVIRHTALGVPE